jgi:HPt (histidine-containing phosphotransfer) domain-containing protein
VLPGLDPIRNALQAGPERAWRAYAQAIDRSIEDLSIASAMFRAALLADAEDEDAMRNLRYARSQIVELRRERERLRVEFEEFLNEVIQPQEALEKIMDLTERQGGLAGETGGAQRLRSSERAERVSEILRDQSRVTAETEDLLRRLDAMAKRGDELFGDQNPLLATMLEQLLGTGADAIADAVGAQRWADFELRGEELDAAEDLQLQAADDLRSILEDFASQVEDIQDLLEMFAEQMEQQVEQVEQEFDGRDPEQQEDRPVPGEIETDRVEPGSEEAERLAREILRKEQRDTDRRDEFERSRRRDRGENDW